MDCGVQLRHALHLNAHRCGLVPAVTVRLNAASRSLPSAVNVNYACIHMQMRHFMWFDSGHAHPAVQQQTDMHASRDATMQLAGSSAGGPNNLLARQSQSAQACMVFCRPTAKYAPWFATVLKTCRLAVKVIHMLVQEVSHHKPVMQMLVSCMAPSTQDQAASEFEFQT